MQKHLIYILQSILLYSYKFWSTAFVVENGGGFNLYDWLYHYELIPRTL